MRSETPLLVEPKVIELGFDALYENKHPKTMSSSAGFNQSEKSQTREEAAI